MAIKKIEVSEFFNLNPEKVFDVRSPSEYNHAHIPGAVSLPLFTDEERKVIGTIYKQKSRELAIKTGLDYFGPKMRSMVEEVERSVNDSGQQKKIYVHCWRGGMRSAAVAWLLDLYGFEVTVLTGGYKAYRNWVLEQFEKDYAFNIIGGYTGSQKSILLRQIAEKGIQIIDLEKIAEHKGSAFGGIGMPPQPTQEMFENELALSLFNTKKETIWLEDESQRIGILNIPNALWKTIRTKPVYFIELPFEIRLANIDQEYGSLDREKLADAILRIQKRLGPLETKTAINFLEEENMHECFRILLSYYDKTYEKALHNRENLSTLLNRIPGNADNSSILDNLICGTVHS